jgi:hypothetical protein
MYKDNLSFSRDDTKIIKAVAIMLMCAHHLFRFNDRIVDNIVPISLTTFNGVDMAYYIGDYGKICVSIFFFCGGYGLYIAYKKGNFNVINRILNVFVEYWKVFIIFVPIGFLFFNSQPDYCVSTYLCHKFEKFNIVDFIGCFLGLNQKYNNEWWFLKSYIVMLIALWCWGGVIRKHTFAQNLLGVIIYDIVLEAVVPTFPDTIIFKNLQNNYLFDSFIKKSVPYSSCFWMGCAMAKSNIIEQARVKLSDRKMFNVVSDILVIFCTIVVRQSIIGASVDMFLVPILAIFVTDLVKRIRLSKVFIEIGNRSTYMWLTHTFFCYYYYPITKIIYAPKYAIAIWALLMVITYIVSVSIDVLYSWIGKARKQIATMLIR